jgi:hypothetical protein
MRTRNKLASLRLGESCTAKSKLFSYDWVRDNVPMREVARALGLQARGLMIRCPRRHAHKHGDATPSMHVGTTSNKAYCHVCDSKPLSNIDLVMLVNGGITGTPLTGSRNAGLWKVLSPSG